MGAFLKGVISVDEKDKLIEDLKRKLNDQQEEIQRLRDELEDIHSHALCIVTQATRALKIDYYAE
jgi:predicted RNase H-like nuclease (RuvC/YqgF family)